LRKQQEKKMASDFHLKIDGVEGESAHADHKGEIEVLSWSWAVSNSSSSASGGGSGTGKSTFSDLNFTHLYSKASPNLAKSCATGKHFPTVKFTARKQGEGSKDYLVFTLKEAFITSVSTSGGSGGDVTEQFSMSYKDIEMAYKPQDEKGSMGGEVKFMYDVAATKAR
jgi:type VI secretion system secreted protein Hcp